MGILHDFEQYKNKKHADLVQFMIIECTYVIKTGLIMEIPLRDIYEKNTNLSEDSDMNELNKRAFTAVMLDMHTEGRLVGDDYQLLKELLEDFSPACDRGDFSFTAS